MSDTMFTGGFYEATERIYTVDALSSKDRWIAPTERFTLVGNKQSWHPCPMEQLYYDLMIGSQRLKVRDKELEGKAKKVDI